MWDIPAYRKMSPGERLVEQAVRELGAEPGDSFIDFGCGTGRPAQKLISMGYSTSGVDHADNCLDPDVSIPFSVQCLWDLPKDMRSDFGFCTDVMEHIPTEKVHDVLSEIRRVCQKGAFFQIATFLDGMGRHIGERLHLTVRGPVWWREQLSEHWETVSVSGQRNIVAVVK